MQTFLPYVSFRKSAVVLDNKRLGKQRVEAYQILKILLKLRDHPKAKPAWRNHPAVLMWKNWEPALCVYGADMCHEWARRGYEDNLEWYFIEAWLIRFKGQSATIPTWLTPKLTRSHRSNLLRKHPNHYRRYWPKLRDDLPYHWPIKLK